MPTTLGPRVRLVLYIVSGIGSAIVAYLAVKNIVGDAEVALWTALVGVVNGIAAANVPSRRDERGALDPLTALVAAILAVVLLVLILALIGNLQLHR